MSEFVRYMRRYVAVGLGAGIVIAVPASLLFTWLLPADAAIGCSFLFGILVGGLAPLFFIDWIAE